MPRKKRKTRPNPPFCKCGCGSPTTYRKGKYSTWVVGHFKRKKREIISCACGCGTHMLSVDIHGRSRRYIVGHHRRGKPSANRGRKLSKEWKRNMSLSLLRVWKRKKKLLYHNPRGDGTGMAGR